jgi:hypothetical protein
MKINAFDPPANVNDVDNIPLQREAWSEFISFVCDREVKRLKTIYKDAGDEDALPQFYNAITGNGITDAPATQNRTWNGFPRVADQKYGLMAHEEAEKLKSDTLGYTLSGEPILYNYRYQDEYLEWFATRDKKTGKITKVTFTCEGPEYWSALANGQPSAYYSYDDFDEQTFTATNGAKGSLNSVRDLYRTILGNSKISSDDLIFFEDIYSAPADDPKRRIVFKKGEYNPWNRYNTTDGAVHLTHPANTLGAEINLAAQATVLRKNANGSVKDALRLICCSGYGNATRNSDPSIGYFVNGFAQGKFFVTLLNPIGLYIASFESTGIETPDGADTTSFWKVIRPTAQVGDPYTRYLRLEFSVPTEKNYVVGDLKIASQNIDYGGQLARRVTVMLVGAVDGENIVTPALDCVTHGCRSLLNKDLVQVVRDLDTSCRELGAWVDVDDISDLQGLAHEFAYASRLKK